MLGFMYKAEEASVSLLGLPGGLHHVLSVVLSRRLYVHQNPVVLPPGGILTLTELRLGEFLTETAGSKSGPGSGC